MATANSTDTPIQQIPPVPPWEEPDGRAPAARPEVDDFVASYELGYCAALIRSSGVSELGAVSIERILEAHAARYRRAGRRLEARAFARAAEASRARRLDESSLLILRRLLQLGWRIHGEGATR